MIDANGTIGTNHHVIERAQNITVKLMDGTVIKEVEILAVNEDDDARQLAFLEKRALPFPVLVDPGGAVAAQYGVDAFPVSILVDGAGNVLKVIRGASELLPHVVENRLDRLRAAVGGGASHG